MHTPTEINNYSINTDSDELSTKSKYTYQGIVGWLLYISLTILDQTYAMSIVSHYMHSPHNPYASCKLNAVFEILSKK